MVRFQRRNDHGAFACLVGRWEGRIRRLCLRMTGDLHRAEDLAQETFARLCDRRRDYRPEAQLSTYLWRIALNLCYDELRRRKSESVRSETAGAPSSAPDAPDDLAERREEIARVRDAVLELPEIYRTALVLRHYEDLKLHEIAGVLDVPEGTVCSRIAEALARLGRRLAPAGGAGAAAARGSEPCNTRHAKT